MDQLPVKLDISKVNHFAKRCAKLRNDISHFGAQRHGENYQDFVLEVRNNARALEFIFHILILNEIGIDAKIINSWIYENFQSYLIKSAFVAAGLLDESVLKPNFSPAAGGSEA